MHAQFPERVTLMSSPATTDLSDAHPNLVRHCEPLFRDYGGNIAFHGPMLTLKTFEDNTKVRKAVEGPGEGRVLVVDSAASKRCALFGGNLGKLAQENGWAGVVINGCVRDTRELAQCKVGIKALAAHPKKSNRNDAGEFGVPVSFAGVTFHTGDMLYADADGIIVSKEPLA
jgi:regulator of ribonuclease activity A